MRLAFQTLTALLLALLLGLHWAVLQTVAWTGMAWRYSQSHGLRTGLSMTFDGQHPCRLCQAVSAGRAAEKEREQQALGAEVSRLEAVLPTASPCPAHSARGVALPSAALLGPDRVEAPPKPRPRLNAAA